MLAPVLDDVLDISKAMFSGGYSARNFAINSEFLSVQKIKAYSIHINKRMEIPLSDFIGLFAVPEDSAFSGQKWALALMMPAEDIKYSLTRFNLQLAVMFSLLMILGAAISFFLSKQYLKPITNSIDMIKSKVWTKN